MWENIGEGPQFCLALTNKSEGALYMEIKEEGMIEIEGWKPCNCEKNVVRKTLMEADVIIPLYMEMYLAKDPEEVKKFKEIMEIFSRRV
jgi:hypothetical protein